MAHGGWRRLRMFNAERAALQLESQLGGLESLLVTAIQFRDHPQAAGSTDLRNHTCELAEKVAADLQPREAAPYTPLQRPAIFATVLLGVIAVFAVVNGPFLAAGFARIFTLWTTIEYPTNTQIALALDGLVVKEGDRAEITANLTGRDSRPGDYLYSHWREKSPRD